MYSIGQLAITGIFSHLIFIWFAWRLLQVFNLETFIRKGRAKEAQIMLLFIAIVIGTGVSRFFLDILQWTKDMMYLF
ncbi:DUF1146 domain-containing protein [Ornithinibacillus gellani]|uniref:DUF1146 family protein n=1 Tax=Ornithinibacillus gellani TaxID=2293253 RepID=UPI000F48D433|nr:DUF1146 family protein [Ornithinibacillus gellani]TQS72170.1 DUF1146 domain-containing protein [Ornithinibacillus gellani]